MLCPDHAYYFYIPGEHPEAYPIFPSFAHWVFPNPTMPSDFMSTTMTPFTQAPGHPTAFYRAVIERDRSCRLSLYRDDIESAHLVPREEAEWFKTNAMGNYRKNQMLPGDYFLDDITNGITFRKDLHSCFDRKNFAIVPNGQWVVHFFCITYDHGPHHHNQPIELLRDVSPQFILARFG